MRPAASSSRRSGWWWLRLLLSVGLLVAALLALFNRHVVYDAYRLHGYQPPAAISKLADDTTMTAYARHMFYVNQPQQEGRGSFSNYCPSGTEQSVVLGCYKSGERGIYLLHVTTPELDGIQQVTAAHETLHAAYERLSSAERARVDGMLTSYYNSASMDPSIKQTIEGYRKTEPNDIINEMHSIIGTESTGLPLALERYYTKYFTNRAAITADYGRYNAAFTSRQQQLKRYDAQLDELQSRIDDLDDSVMQQQKMLQSSRSSVDARSAQQVAAYNAKIDAFNADIQQLKALTSQYNDIVGKRNSIAYEEQQLVQAISAPTVREQ